MSTVLALGDYGHTGLAESVAPQLHTWHERGHEIWQLVSGYDGWVCDVSREAYPWAERILPIFGSDPIAAGYGRTTLARAVVRSQADVLLTGLDIWMTAYLSDPANARFGLDNAAIGVLGHATRRFKHVAYIPIDGAVGNTRLPEGLAEVVRGYDVPVTYSRYGQQILKNEGLDVPFIPIAHDPRYIHPGSREEARKALNVPQDKFVVAMIATNQYRKHWGVFIEAASARATAHRTYSSFRGRIGI